MKSQNPTAAPHPKRATVVPVRPALLGEPDAATYLGRSASWMRQRRGLDLAAIRADQEPDGPPWVTIESSIFYRPEDLDHWVHAKAVLRGRAGYRGQDRLNASHPGA